jgi:hypothetical protein
MLEHILYILCVMPPRPPPQPGPLTILCAIAAIVATWMSVAVDQLVRGFVGSLFGVPFLGVQVSDAHRFLLHALQGPSTSVGAGAFAFMVLGGAAANLLLAWGLYTFVRAVHAAGWLRAIALEWVVVALIWIPAAMAAALLSSGTGPGHELYARLGPPMAGRWAALALSLVALVMAAGPISRCAVAIGRAWMRADGLEFRRRLVRVTAAWPAVTALVILAYANGWAPSPWAILFPMAALLALQLQTR